MEAYPKCDIYVTGHSLGGNLAYNAGSKAISINNSKVKKITMSSGAYGEHDLYSFLKQLGPFRKNKVKNI